MLRGLAISSVLVLLVVSSSWADLLQYQDFGIGGQNQVAVIGHGAASNTNVLTVGQLQQGADKTGLFRSVQGEVGALAQGAGAGGLDGVYAVAQQGGVNGYQQQTHLGTNLADLGTQIQGVGVDLLQQLTKQGALGAAIGLQAVVGVQVQLTASPFGVGVNIQPISVAVFDVAGQ